MLGYKNRYKKSMKMYRDDKTQHLQWMILFANFNANYFTVMMIYPMTSLHGPSLTL